MNNKFSEVNNKEPIVHIIDDFYPSLDWVYLHLESHLQISRENVNYGSLIYPAPTIETQFALKKIHENFEQLKRDTTNPSYGLGEVRLTLAKHENNFKSFIHTDDSFNVVVYLSSDTQQHHLGTTFYRHKEFKINSSYGDELSLKKLQAFFDFDTKSMERWEVIKQVPHKQNRAVCFDGRFYHSPPPEFYGTDFRDGRITQHFLFNYLRAQHGQF